MRWVDVIAVFVVALMFFAGVPTQGQVQEAESSLSAVTLYRGQAQITRDVAVPAGEGAVELVVSGLPDQIQPGSLFAEGGQGIDVRAVRYRERVVGQEPRDDIRALDEQIIEQQSLMQTNQAMQELVNSRFAYLHQLESFAATTATSELSSGVLDAGQLRDTTTFIFDQREQATVRLLELRNEARVLQVELQSLQQQRSLLAGRSQTTVREAVLFLDRRDAQANEVKLTYLVGNCGWSPSYNVRGDLAGGTMRVEYNALVRQMSGEDWQGVELTLSTASPMINSSSPTIAAFPVSLQALTHGGRAVTGNFDPTDSPEAAARVGDEYRGIMRSQVSNSAEFNGIATRVEGVQVAWSSNVFANSRQLFELCEPVTQLMPASEMLPSAEQGLSISYVVPGLVSVQSRADQQMTRIMQSELEGEFYYVANPVMTQYVYREAEAVNTSGQDLLAGPVSVYLDGRFVGRTEMVSVTRGQTFIMGFGTDPQLTASRQILEREQQQQGGNTRLHFAYRLAIENYGDTPAEVRLYDRLPHFGSDHDVQLTEESGFDGLSTDPVYVRKDRPLGILRWDITVAASATGEDASITEYRYTLEFDRNYGLSSEVTEQLRMEFEQRDEDRRAR